MLTLRRRCGSVITKSQQAAVGAAVDAVHAWSLKKKLTLNTRKCEVSFFSPSTHEARWRPTVTLGNETLGFNATPSFLGVKLDRSLSFVPHTEKVAATVVNRCRLLGALAGRSWGQARAPMSRTCRALVRSVMDYCGAAWQPWLSNTSIEKLERAQNRSLRVVTGQLASTPVECLRLEAGVSSYSTIIKRNTLVAYERSLRLPKSNPRRDVALQVVTHRTKTRSSWRTKAIQWLPQLELGRSPVRLELPLLSTAPWLIPESRHWRASLALAGGSTKSSPVEVLQQDAVGTILSHGVMELVIYSDGSVVSGTDQGAYAMVVTSGDVSNPTRLGSGGGRGPPFTSSFEMEALALSLAVDYVGNTEVGGPVLICTDSLSVLSALVGSKPHVFQEITKLRRKLDLCRTEIRLQWVPGHCGLPGNDLADQLAKSFLGETTGEWNPAVSFSTAKALVRRRIVDPAPSHDRAQQVYVCRRGPGVFSRDMEVLPAQLRSGHCKRLRAYAAIINPGVDPICVRCGKEP